MKDHNQLLIERRIWWAQNKDRINKQRREDRKLNPEKYHLLYKYRYKKNRKKILLQSKASKLRRKGDPKFYAQLLKNYEKQGKLHNMSALEFKWSLYYWANAVKKLANNTCQICDRKAVHAHHIFPRSLYPILALNLNNGIALCKEHHREIHKLHYLPKSNRRQN